MNERTLGEAIDQARRFLTIAKQAQAVVKEDKGLFASKQTAAAKRASMDLSRALSEMRKCG